MNENQWISAEDRMPEEIDGESKAVLAIVRIIFNHRNYVDHYQLVWCEHKKWCTSPKGRVLYWMPLSEPPEEDET